MEEQILANKNLIYYIISRYFSKYPNKDDLFQAGCIGIITAYLNYKPELDVKFTTYAYSFILGEMRKLVREDKSVKVSRNIQKLNLQIEKASLLLTQKMMREPTIEELAQFLEVPSYFVSEAINSTKPTYSIDEPLNNEGKEITLQDTIGQIDDMDKDDLLLLKEELSKLNSFEQNLINKRYMEDLTQQQTADALGITQVQVSRGEKKILTKLRSKLVA